MNHKTSVYHDMIITIVLVLDLTKMLSVAVGTRIQRRPDEAFRLSQLNVCKNVVLKTNLQLMLEYCLKFWQ